MRFVLVRCPEGIIGTVADGVDITVDRTPTEARGYALVEESLARNLVARNEKTTSTGYEVVPLNEFPRNIHRLPKHVRDREGLRHAVLNLDGTISIPSPVKVSSVKPVADRKIEPCIFCKITNRFFRAQTGQG